MSARIRRPVRTEQGFTLFETLVALGIAMLMVASVSRALGSAWLQASASEEITAASALARSLIANVRTEALSSEIRREGFVRKFHWQMTGTLIVLDGMSLPTTDPGLRVAPDMQPDAPADGDHSQPPAGLKNVSQPKQLYRINVVVTTPTGRHTALEGLVVADSPMRTQPK